MKTRYFSLSVAVVSAVFASSVQFAQAHYITPAMTDAQVNVVVLVDNSQGGSAAPSTFTVAALTDSMDSKPSPMLSQGSTTTPIDFGQDASQDYSIIEVPASVPANYVASYSAGCSGTVTVGEPIVYCVVTDTYVPQQ